MDQTMLEFEGPDFLVVTHGKRVLLRFPNRYLDLGDNEPLEAFIRRHGGLKEAVLYVASCARQRAAQLIGMRLLPPKASEFLL